MAEGAGPGFERPPGLGHRRRPGMVVGVEQGQLQVDVHAVGGVQLADHADQVVGLLGGCRLTGGPQGVALGDGVLGQRLHLDDVGQQLGGIRRPAQGNVQLGPSGLGRGEARERGLGGVVAGPGAVEIAGGQEQVAQQHLHIGDVLAAVGTAGGHRLGHGLDRARVVASQFAGVRDTRERGQVGPHVGHPLRRRQRLVVTAQFVVGVDQHAQRALAVRGRSQRPPADRPGVVEPVLGQGQGAGRDQHTGIGRRRLQQRVEQAASLDVQRRVSRLPHFLQEGVGQVEPRLLVGRIGLERLLGLGDGPVGRRRAGRVDRDERHRSRRRARAGRATAPASRGDDEQQAESGGE